ncbi:hypothetical protein DRN67_04500 [Candidatus Micrarchaeota archaeon]|nr:MAG: hypothetical protein DRN67_04500 [Candidatus Micrarchaeota archaeon]
MRISVIIPSYNEERAIGECISSLYAQTRKPDEVLVVDDSTDSTPDLVRKLSKKHKGLRLIRGKRKGVSAARNLGARQAKADVILFLDADKRLEASALKEVEEFFSNESAKLAAFKATMPSPKTFIEKCYYVRLLHLERGQPWSKELIVMPEAFRRSVFLELGGFDESLHYFEDRELYNRVRAAGLKVQLLKSKIYHEEPANLREFWKQAKWLGSSITSGTVLLRIRAIFYPLGPVYWFFFLLAVLVTPFYQPMIYAVYAFALFAFFEFLRCMYMSKMILPSLGYIFLSFWRQVIVGYGLLRKLLSKLI